MQQIKLFDFRGTEVSLHPTFFLLPAVVVGPEFLAGQFSAVMNSLSMIAVLFFCIVLHEFGHIGMARKLGFETGDVVLTPLGGLAKIYTTGETGRDEVLIAAAGPVVNLVIIAVSFLLMNIVSPALAGAGPMVAGGLYTIILINTVLAVFNLIPLFPMDGGRMLRGILRFWMTPAGATCVAVYTGWAVAAAISVLGLLIGNFMIPMIAGFMCFIGYQELTAARRDR